jgi:hypothetical protein
MSAEDIYGCLWDLFDVVVWLEGTKRYITRDELL